MFYRRYVLGIMTLVLAINFLDRGLIMLLLQPIKQDLQLSDTQLGFLTGIAFGLFYATVGLPIARWADRGDRVTITSVSIGLWGVTVMSCIAVVNFAQLAIARIAAAVGEAGCMPPTYSLVGDYFPGAAERSRAMAVYWLASPLSQLISFVLGSRVYEHLGWRMTFFVMGLPALFVAVIVRATVVEPRRGFRDGEGSGEQSGRPLGLVDTVGTLWHGRACRHLCSAIVLTLALSLGAQPWYAAFLVRSHGIGVDELGVWLGLILGVSGAAGICFGGFAAGRWFANNERIQLRVASVMIGLLMPCFALFLLLPDAHGALIAMVPMVFVWNTFLGPSFALVQRLVGPEIRATSLAIVMLIANLFGMGVLPQVIGILSDSLSSRFGDDSLRYSLLSVSLIALWASLHFWRAGDQVDEDLQRVDRPMGLGAKGAAMIDVSS